MEERTGQMVTVYGDGMKEEEDDDGGGLGGYLRKPVSITLL